MQDVTQDKDEVFNFRFYLIYKISDSGSHSIHMKEIGEQSEKFLPRNLVIKCTSEFHHFFLPNK